MYYGYLESKAFRPHWESATYLCTEKLLFCVHALSYCENITRERNLASWRQTQPSGGELCRNLSVWIENALKPVLHTSWHFLFSSASPLVYTSSCWQWIASSTLKCRSDKDNSPALTKTFENTNSQIHPLRHWQQWEVAELHNNLPSHHL